MLEFPLQFDDTTPRLCKSVLSSAREPAGGSFRLGLQGRCSGPSAFWRVVFQTAWNFGKKNTSRITLESEAREVCCGKSNPRWCALSRGGGGVVGRMVGVYPLHVNSTPSQSSLSSISHLLLYPLYPLYTVVG